MAEHTLSNQASSPAHAPIDFLIITALPEERDAVLRHLGKYQKVQRGSFPTYYRSSIPLGPKGNQYEVAVLMLDWLGNVEAARSAAQAIPDLQPAYVLMVGVAGGVKGKVKLGDVVVAEQVLYYAQTKQKPEGPDFRPMSYMADPMLWNRARNFTDRSWRDRIMAQRPDGLGHAMLQVHFAPVAVGEEVVADQAITDRLRTIHSKLSAIEMESFGVASAAAHAAGRPGFLAIRGICDYADSEKNDDWHTYAAESAAAFAIDFLRSGSVEPRRASVAVRSRRRVWGSGAFWQKFALGMLVVLLVVLLASQLLLPRIATSLNDQGLEYYVVGRLDDALNYYRLALVLNPGYGEAHYNLGVLCEDTRDFDCAKAEYSRAVLGGLDAAYNNLGRLFILGKEYETAVNLLLPGLDRASDPDVRYDLLKNLGWARLKQGRHNEAKAHLQAAIDIRFDRAPAHCLLAQVLEAQGDTASSLVEWDLCLQYAEERNPDEDVWIAMARERLRPNEGEK